MAVLPSECLLLVLAYLWDNDYDLATQFFDQRSHRSVDYDQRRIHHVLRSRSISPLHVCRGWRSCAMPRFFRFTVVDLIGVDDRPAKQVPPWALPFVDRVFLALAPEADDNSDNNGANVACRQTTLAGRLAYILPNGLPRARVLGLYSIDSQTARTNAWQQQQRLQNAPPRELLQGEGLGSLLLSILPNLERIWFQSSDWVRPRTHNLVRALTAPQRSGRPSCRVTAIHLAASNRRNAAAIDIIHQSACDLEFLSLGYISGGILGDITHTTCVIPQHQHHHQQPAAGLLDLGENDARGHAAAAAAGKRQVIYPKLKRLLFAVDVNAHIYASLPSYRACPFPSLVDLHFDDSLSNGLPREEWYAPLYDVFLKHADMKLRRLTFPVVYNTQRTVSARNCPELVDLRHIKCCWATGPWDTAQNESDSTRVLRAITSISTLRRYVHPSYIARLSGMPASISCLSLSHLDLYGWPLTLRDLGWVLRTFSSLTTLNVTLTRAIEWDNERARHGADAEDSTHFAGGYTADEFADVFWSPLKRLTIGATDFGLALWEWPYLLDL
ncbi:hypothetical protein GGI20_004945, partial [Coemansia sp. BCRC 34301]